LTRHLFDRWLANDRFLQLHFLRGEDWNPEYRIAEDVRVATDAPVSMARIAHGAAQHGHLRQHPVECRR
jgi:ABC-type uncharacterized transport system fused permease/ATPase subunit